MTFSSELKAIHADTQLQTAEQRSLRMLLHAGLAQCGTQVQNAVQLIFFANIALFYSMIRTASAVPPRVLFDEPAVLEDAFGRHVPIHTQCISSWEVTIANPNFSLTF